MLAGEVDEIASYLEDSADKERLNNILKEIGYGRKERGEQEENGENPKEDNDKSLERGADGRIRRSLGEIEEELKQKKIISRQTKDAWAAIPDDLKLKLVNDGASLLLAYANSTVVVSLSGKREVTNRE